MRTGGKWEVVGDSVVGVEKVLQLRVRNIVLCLPLQITVTKCALPALHTVQNRHSQPVYEEDRPFSIQGSPHRQPHPTIQYLKEVQGESHLTHYPIG